MKKMMILAMIAVVTLLLSGCVKMGVSDDTIKRNIEAIEGVDTVMMFTPIAGREAHIKLSVMIDPEWYVKDPAAFSDYLIRTMWAYSVPSKGIEISVIGGTHPNFDWFDSVLDGYTEGSLFGYVSTFDGFMDEGFIELDRDALEAKYGEPRGDAPKPKDNMLRKGVAPSSQASPVLSPVVELEDGSFYFDADTNNVTEDAYEGDVRILITDDTGRTVVDSGTEKGFGVRGNHVSAYGVHRNTGGEYTITISMSPQSGYNTDSKRYTFQFPLPVK